MAVREGSPLSTPRPNTIIARSERIQVLLATEKDTKNQEQPRRRFYGWSTNRVVDYDLHLRQHEQMTNAGGLVPEGNSAQSETTTCADTRIQSLSHSSTAQPITKTQNEWSSCIDKNEKSAQLGVDAENHNQCLL